MRQLKLIAITTLLSLSLFSCSGNGPEGVTKKFVKLTSQGEFTEAKELCTEKTASLLSMAEGFAGDKISEMKEKNKDVDVEIVSSEVNDDKATVKYKVTGIENNDNQEKSLDLVKVDGDWKVDINKEGMR